MYEFDVSFLQIKVKLTFFYEIGKMVQRSILKINCFSRKSFKYGSNSYKFLDFLM